MKIEDLGTPVQSEMIDNQRPDEVTPFEVSCRVEGKLHIMAGWPEYPGCPTCGEKCQYFYEASPDALFRVSTP